MAATAGAGIDLPESVVRFLERRLRLESVLAGSPAPDVAVLRPAFLDVLDAVESVAEDELLWQQALLGAASLTAEVLAELDALVDDRLPALLVLAGYLLPPPVDVVVDGVATALTEARRHVAAGGPPEAPVAAARTSLREFVRTARERTSPDAGARTAVRVLRHWSRRTSQLAEQLVPAVVGGAVAAMLGHRMGTPGVDLVEVLGFATATKATERLMELTAASVFALVRGPVAEAGAPDPVRDAQRALLRLRGSLDAVPASADALPRTSAPLVRRLETGLLATGQRTAVQRRAREAQRDLAVLELAARRAGLGLPDARAVREALDALVEVGTPGDLVDRAAELHRASGRLRRNASRSLMLLARRTGPGEPR